MSADEQVLVLDRDELMGDPGWHGIRHDGIEVFERLVTTRGRFVERQTAEQDRRLKQVIPYLVLRDGARYFLMRRTQGGGDPRLHGRYSLGIGGHLNPGDVGLAGGLRREWTEELIADFVPGFQLLGLLNDDATDVGSVHLGAIYLGDAEGRPVAIRETDKLEGAFAMPDAVRAVADQLESWSAMIFRHLEDRRA